MMKPPYTRHASGDLRNSRRMPVPVRVRVRYGDHGDVAYDCKDVSLEGVFLQSALLHELGEEVELAIDLPDGNRIEALGEVVRVELGMPGEGQGMGIAFVEMSPADHDLLANVCTIQPTAFDAPRGAPVFRAAGSDVR